MNGSFLVYIHKNWKKKLYWEWGKKSFAADIYQEIKKAVDENFSYTKSQAQREENYVWD